MYTSFSILDDMGAHLSPYGMKPVLDCTGEVGTGPGFRYGATTMQGWRKSQEDTYKCEVQGYFEGYHYFAVFDGHGGSEVAKYLQRKLHEDIKAFLNKQEDPELALQLGFLTCDASLRDPAGIQELNEMVEAENQLTVANIEKNRRAFFAGINYDGAGCSKGDAGCSKDVSSSKDDMDSNSDSQEGVEIMSIDEVVSSTQDEIVPNEENEGDTEGQMDTLKYLLKDDLDNSDTEDEDFDVEDEGSSSESGNEDTFEDMENLEPGVHSGSTGTVLLFDLKQYFCANVGDSRCVLCRGGKAIDMSLDHKPDDPEEMKRINATGSVVSDGRINKSLNLSRAFGDFYYKDPSLAPFEQCVTAEPSIKTLSIEDDDEFIILASDGIWNSMSSQEVVDFVSIRLKEENNLQIITEELFRLIIAPDTNGDGTGCDNMTCIIILLDPSKMRCNPDSGKLPAESNLLSQHEAQGIKFDVFPNKK